MNMEQFYDVYQISKFKFATLIGVSWKSVEKYANGEKILNKTKNKIENAIQIFEDNNLVRPVYTGRRWDWHIAEKHDKKVREYEFLVRSLLEEGLGQK